MSKLVQLMKAAVQSSGATKFNSFMVALWTALSQSDFVVDNPEYAAVIGGIQAVINLLIGRKKKPQV